MATISRSVTVTAPASEPISLSEAKASLDIASADDTHDATVLRHIVAARIKWEDDTNRFSVSRTVAENLDEWPDDCWRFYYQPVISITSITYYDTANASQTLATSVYEADIPNRKIKLKVDQSYPSTETRWDAITVTYLAGEAAPISEIAKQAMTLLIKLYFSDLDNAAAEKHERAYHNLMLSYARPSYP